MLKELATKLYYCIILVYFYFCFEELLDTMYAFVTPRTLDFTVEKTQYLGGYADQSTTKSL